MKQKNDRLAYWQTKLEDAKIKYATMLDKIEKREKLYFGDKDIRGKNGGAAKKATNVRNIVYELIESQVDTSIPQPRVTALHPEDKDLARQAEELLRNEARRLGFGAMNDQSERTVPVQGGDIYHVEWDPSAGYHCTLGDITVTERHPRQIIPQPGIYDVDKMRYIFVLMAQDKEDLQEKYGIEISEDVEDMPEIRGDQETSINGLVTQNVVYYRKNGVVGMFSWVGNQVLEDLPDYYARRETVCKKCGREKQGETCVCGSEKFVERTVDMQELPHSITVGNEVLPTMQYGPDQPIMNPDGSLQKDNETGEEIMMPGELQPTMIPVYRPTGFPVVLRRNITMEGRFLGVSDVDVIADQQESVKKFGTKIEEKLLKGGSYVTMPEGVQIETTDEELKIIRLRNANDKSMIDVLNVQPNTSYDLNQLENNYAWAKSTLGITDAFQGKYDSSATSGSAKQFSANQSAGRMQSKREMKNEAFARLYKLMFQFLLAYSDEEYPIVDRDIQGNDVYSHFDRFAFLKRDAAGQLYWNDEFLFEVDPASNLASNRERLWDMVDVKYQSGGFGPINDLNSAYLMWTLLKETNFPQAGIVQAAIKERLDQQNAALGGVANDVGGNPTDNPAEDVFG